MTSIFKNFYLLRASVGISMMINGYPIIFFFRDALHLGGGSAFTAAFLTLGLVLMIPPRVLGPLYKPNIILAHSMMAFLGILLYYFFLFAAVRSVNDYANFGLSIGFFILLLYFPNDGIETLLKVTFLVSLFSNFSLVYSLLTNPDWVIGMRAAISYGADDSRGGNPHQAARNALICFLSAYFLLTYCKGVFMRVALILSIFFSLGILVLAQSKATYLGLALILGVHFVFGIRPGRIAGQIKGIFEFKNLLVLGIVSFILYFFLSRYFSLALLTGTIDTLLDRFQDVWYTTTGGRSGGETASIDASAMGRVASFDYLKKNITEPHIVLFGTGYKKEFMDVPVIEMLANHGIVGATIFIVLNLFLTFFAMLEIIRKDNPWAQFLGYFYLYFIPLLITTGRPVDTSFLFPYLVFMRFLGVQYYSLRQRELAT